MELLFTITLIYVFMFIKFFHYCQCCDRKAVLCCSMFDIKLHPLQGTDDMSGDVMIGGQCYTFCCWTYVWSSLSFKLLLNFVLWSWFLFSLQFGFLFFMLTDCCWSVVRSEISRLWIGYWVISHFFSGWLNSEVLRNTQQLKKFVNVELTDIMAE